MEEEEKKKIRTSHGSPCAVDSSAIENVMTK